MKWEKMRAVRDLQEFGTSKSPFPKVSLFYSQITHRTTQKVLHVEQFTSLSQVFKGLYYELKYLTKGYDLKSEEVKALISLPFII